MSAMQKKNVTKLNTEYASKQQNEQKVLDRKRIGLIRRLTLFGIVALLFSIFMITTIVSQRASINEKKEEKIQLTQQLSKLQQKEKQLKEEVVKLNDEEYIKKIARRDYFLSEQDEIIFNVKEEVPTN